MLPRFIASQAWVERHSLSDTDLAWFADCDLAGAVSASDGNRCPKCRRHPEEDCEVQLPVPDATMSTPERITGRAYVRCLCGTVYHYAFVHDVDAHQPVGQTRVRAASEVAVPEPAPPPQHRTLDSNDISLARYRHQSLHPAFYQQNVSAAVIWATVEAQRRAVAATTTHLRQNPATD
jgi:hypothetical protein